MHRALRQQQRRITQQLQMRADPAEAELKQLQRSANLARHRALVNLGEGTDGELLLQP
jgi:hypothetical protein